MILETNSNYLYSRADLEPHAEQWYTRIHETLDDHGCCYYVPYGSAKASCARLHLCPHFPGECDCDPNARVHGNAYCARAPVNECWRPKTPAMFPPAYRDVCGYCVYRFVRWWDATHE